MGTCFSIDWWKVPERNTDSGSQRSRPGKLHENSQYGTFLILELLAYVSIKITSKAMFVPLSDTTR